MAETTRAFLAITPPPEIIDNLAATVLPTLRQTFGKALRLVPPPNMHITLKFLGDVSKISLMAMTRKMRKVAAITKPFALRLQGIGAFPSWRRARVLWVGANSVPAALLSLHHHSEVIAAEHGVNSDNKPYQPHLTVARTREVLNIGDGQMAPLFGVLSEEFIVSSVELFASELTPAGAIYSLVEQFKLRGIEQ